MPHGPAARRWAWTQKGYWTRGRELATPQATGASLGVFYLAGGAAVLAVRLAPAPRTPFSLIGGAHADELLLTVAAVALLVGALVSAYRAVITITRAHLLVGLGTGMISVAVLSAPSAASASALAAVFVFVSIESVSIFPPWSALLHHTGSIIGAATTLLLRGDAAPGYVLALLLVLTASGTVVGVLARHASDSRVDSLTGLRNRRGLDEALDEATSHATRSNKPLCVGLLDLDGFGAVNNTLGHQAGDDLLRAASDTWRRLLPSDVVLARTGGDEFAVLLPGRGTDEAAALLDPLCADRTRPASAGIAQLVHVEAAVDLLRRADTALYQAKRTGRGRCVVADRDPLQAQDEVDGLVRDLAVAVREQKLEVFYQPVWAAPGSEDFDADEALLVGAEALARWYHPQRGWVPPAVFVPLAEREGLITELGAFVLSRACADMASMPGAAGSGLRIAVNVSGIELLDPTYSRRLAAVLAATGWPPELLVLEVTESVIEADSQVALATLHEIAQLGVLLAVDDFGTGFSALARLDGMGASILKLDSTLTATVHTSSSRERLVRAAAALADSLGLALVAEGVETIEQARVLAALGCPMLQGYLLGYPEPAAVLADRIDAGQIHPPGAPLPRTALEGLPRQTGTRTSADQQAPTSAPWSATSTRTGPLHE